MEEFESHWHFESAYQSDSGDPSSTPSCRHSAKSEHAYQLYSFWGRPQPVDHLRGGRYGSVIEEVRERCCGLDVHKKTVTACVLTPDDRQIRTFGTTHGELLALADWLAELRVATVGMESTGVFWKPIYNLLEHEFELVVANARHIKAVPGRKTDIKDSEWIAGLLMHGLLKPSFIPDRPQRELRELVRYRRRVVQNKAQIANQMHKVLEGGNIKLASVATDILGVSGREMLRALIAGEKDSSVLAELARGLLRKKLEELRLALHGTVGRHQQFMLGVLLQSLEMYETQIANLDKEVASCVGSPL